MGFEPARQRYIASQKPNALPTELCMFHSVSIVQLIDVFVEFCVNVLLFFTFAA